MFNATDTKCWESLSRWSMKDPDGGRDESIKKNRLIYRVFDNGFIAIASCKSHCDN